MLKRILSTIGLASLTTAQSEGLPATPARPATRTGAPVYPPIDRGLAFVDADEVLASQAELITRLRLTTGCDDATFERLYGRVLRNLAETINLLPATESGAHDGAGGLFRLSLEIGFFALQTSEATIFSARAGVEQRRVLEPRWRYATFLAGLCAELYRPITQMLVSTASGEVWPAYQVGLGEWLNSKGVSSYHVQWVTAAPGTHRPGHGATAYLTHRIIPTESLQYLHEGSIEIGSTLLDCIAGVRSSAFDSSPLQKIVTAVREKVIARDEALKPQRYGKLRVGSHLEPHLLDAMRRLVTNGTWAINRKKARLWYSGEGLFLIWKTAAKEMLDLLREDGAAGVPQDPQTLVELLITAQVFELDRAGSPYWTIQPPEAASELIAVKFSSPLALLAALVDEPEQIASVFRAPVVTETAVESAPDAAQPEAASTPSAATPGAPDAAPAAAPDTVTAPATGQDQKRGSGKQGGAAAAVPKTAPALPRSGPVGSRGGHERDVGANVPEALGGAVTPLCRDVIGALIDDLRSSTTPVQAGSHPAGFAIGIEQVASYGVDATRFIEEVSRLGWLVADPDKPNRKIHEVQLGNKPTRAVVIKRPIAIDLGLTKP